MPNMLAHFGTQGILTRTLLPKADYKVIFLGCLLPDLPWIFARIIRVFPIYIDPYGLQLYVIAQGSLFVTLFVCGALASLSACPRQVFAVLSLNAVFHLLLDALQTKWANGVHLFAPISWEMLNFHLFWPESLPTYILTLFGLGYVGWIWIKGIEAPLTVHDLSTRRKFLFIGLLVMYFILPAIFLDGPFREDNHFVKTIQFKNERSRRQVEFDRVLYEQGEQGDTLETFGDERLRVLNDQFEYSTRVSARAQFTDNETIEVHEIHEHVWWLRDGSSLVGILLLISMWGMAWIRHNS